MGVGRWRKADIALGVGALAVVGAIFGAAITVGREELESFSEGRALKLDQWRTEIEDPTRGEFDEDRLLRRLSEAGMVWLNASTFSIEAASPADVYGMSAAGDAGLARDVTPKEALGLLKTLRSTMAGRRIRREIALFNGARGAAAIRDDSSGPGANCREDSVADSPWRAFRESDASPMAPGAPPPLDFGFMSWDLSRGYGPWSSITGLSGSQKIRFSRDLESAAWPLSIRTVGDIVAVRVDGRDRDDLLKSVEKLCRPDARMNGTKPLCIATTTDENEGNGQDETVEVPPEAREEAPPPSPLRGVGALLTLASAPGAQLDIVVKPSWVLRNPPSGANLPPQLDLKHPDYPRVPLRRTPEPPEDPDSDATVKMRNVATGSSLHIVTWREPSGETRLGLDWRAPAQRGHLVGKATTTIRTSDEKPLFDGDSCAGLKQDAESLGMLPVVGLGKEDPYSLSGRIIGRLPKGEHRDVTLSIDSVAQQAAMAALNKGFEKSAATDLARAALVVMKAGDGADAGELLAVAMAPSEIGTRDMWDLRASLYYAGPRNPLAPFAWRGGDISFQPGSTFKLVTALAAINAAQDGNQDIYSLIDGVDKIRSAGLGLDWNARETDVRRYHSKSRPKAPHGLDNYQGSPTYTSVRGPNRSTPPDLRCGLRTFSRSGDLDLCSAIQHSLNSYFVRSALIADGPRLRTNGGLYEIENPPRDLYFYKALNSALGAGRDAVAGEDPVEFGEWDLAQKLWGEDRIGASRTIMEPVIPGVHRSNINLELALANNAIGQSLVVSPVHMASIATAVARGGAVVPSLIEGGARNGAPLDRDKRALEALRAGMWLVVNEAGGTAYNAFNIGPKSRSLRKSVFGKTGTANFGPDNTLRSAWFVGWVDPQRDPQRWGGERLAFACVVTHARTGGGGACAPIVRDFLLAYRNATQ